jgi:germination protein M
MRRLLTMLLGAVLLLSLSACVETAVSEPKENEILVCYAVTAGDSSRDVVRYLARSVPGGETRIDAALSLLLHAPAGVNVYSPLPQGLSVRSWTLEDGLITVDVSEEYSELIGMDLTLADSCIVLTLTRFEEISSVCITVKDQPVLQREHQVFTADDILLQPDFSDSN